MDDSKLIEEIDSMLAKGVQANREAHLQIQNVMDHFRRQAKANGQRKHSEMAQEIVNTNQKEE